MDGYSLFNIFFSDIIATFDITNLLLIMLSVVGYNVDHDEKREEGS